MKLKNKKIRQYLRNHKLGIDKNSVAIQVLTGIGHMQLDIINAQAEKIKELEKKLATLREQFDNHRKYH